MRSLQNNQLNLHLIGMCFYGYVQQDLMMVKQISERQQPSTLRKTAYIYENESRNGSFLTCFNVGLVNYDLVN